MAADPAGPTVGLVLELADQLLEHVLHGDEPEHDAVLVDDERVGMDELAARLDRVVAAATDAGEKPIVEIVADDDVPMARLHAVHRALLAAGLDRIRHDGPNREAIPLVLPPPSAAERIEALPAKLVIEVLIGGDGQVTVDGDAVGLERFVRLIEERLAGEGRMSVVRLRSAPDAPKGAFHGVLEALNEAGANRVFVDFGDGPGH